MSTPTGHVATLTSRSFAAVLFDLDGTLIDSTEAVLRSWSRWASEWGLTQPPQIPHGVPARQVLAQLVPDRDLERAFNRIEQIEVTEVQGITVLPGAAAALAAVGDHAAIVTSGTRPLVAARLGVTGLIAPQVLVTADDVRVGKPHPEPYLLAAELLGVAPRDCLVVEDAPAGLASAQAAHCRTLAISTSHRPGELSADAVIPSLDQVRFECDESGAVWLRDRG